jgi:dienelactone hydrolase
VLIVAFAASVASASGGTRRESRTRPFPRFPSLCHRADFAVAGKPVRAAICRDQRPGRESGLVVLYGCGGFGGLDYRLATVYAEAGFATMYLDTFALTPPPGRRGFCSVRTSPAVPAAWRTTVLAATRALAAARGVDPHKVGLLGWSLGADLALGVSSVTGAQIAVVVAYSPDVFPASTTRGRAYPPTIALLSGRGDIHSISEARAFHLRLVGLGVVNEVYVYPGGSHYWQGRQGRDGFARAVAFLRHALGGR